jgi:hypothetical protein
MAEERLTPQEQVLFDYLGRYVDTLTEIFP